MLVEKHKDNMLINSEKASKDLGFEYIGIEKSQEYIEIIKNRLDV